MTETVSIDTTDFPCSACGYNLRGLDRGGQCPECGHDISHSWSVHVLGQLDPSRFEAASLPWRRLFARGLAVMFWSGLAFFICQLTGDSLPSQPVARVLITIVRLLSIPAFLGVAVGLLMTLLPRRLATQWQRWLHGATVAVLGLMVLTVVMLVAMAFLHIGWAMRVEPMIWTLSSLSGATGLLAWLYWSIYFPGGLARWMIVLGVLNAATAIAPMVSDGLMVSSSMGRSTMGFPGVGCCDALLILYQNLRFSHHLSILGMIYAACGVASIAMLITLHHIATLAKRRAV